MCGIAGIIGEASRDPASLARMIATLEHRGPNDEGIWFDPDARVGLANRRLAIIDLSPQGHQPMASRDGRYVLTFNGEIYNHRELRAELEARNAVPEGGWRGHSDTETFLEAVAALGLEPTLERSVGMFAFALWDRRERRLLLVRDRFGEKPLYYGWAGRDFVFGSELKALRSHPGFQARIERRAVSLFAARGYVPAPLSIYHGIFKLEPGCILQLRAEAGGGLPDEAPSAGFRSDGLSIWRYWSYREVLRAGLEQPIADEAEALDELERAVARAVQSQSIADVPVGAFLSGGIDSSTIVALYQKHSSQPVRTFTIGFEEDAFNEADHARAVARHFGTEHNERIVTPAEAQEVIPKLAQMYDEPFGDPSQIPTYLVSRFAREQVTVALSGDAGDELFGGYARYFAAARLWGRLRRFPAAIRSVAAASVAPVPAPAWNKVGALVAGRRLSPYFGAKVHNALRAIAPARSVDEVFTSLLDRWSGEAPPVIGGETGSDLFPFDLEVSDDATDFQRMMYCDAVSYLPDDILCKVDRASMAVSLEVHVPFLDHRVAAVAARIPIGMKVQGGSGKHILRKLLNRHAPAQLFERPKSGFGIPVGEWIKGPLRDWAEDLLSPAQLRSAGWLDAQLVRRRWEQHLKGERDSTDALWSILMFEAWIGEQQAESSAAA